MSTTYFFNQPGSLPGVPGLFAGCRVDVADDGTITKTPLTQHPERSVAQETPPLAAEEVPAAGEAATPATVVQMQPAPVSVPAYIGG